MPIDAPKEAYEMRHIQTHYKHDVPVINDRLPDGTKALIPTLENLHPAHPLHPLLMSLNSQGNQVEPFTAGHQHSAQLTNPMPRESTSAQVQVHAILPANAFDLGEHTLDPDPHALHMEYYLSDEALANLFRRHGPLEKRKEPRWCCTWCLANVRESERTAHFLDHKGLAQYLCVCGKRYRHLPDAKKHILSNNRCTLCFKKVDKYGADQWCLACVEEMKEKRTLLMQEEQRGGKEPKHKAPRRRHGRVMRLDAASTSGGTSQE